MDRQPEQVPEEAPERIPEEARQDTAERPGSTQNEHDHDDELVDEWGEESFPGSDPPGHY